MNNPTIIHIKIKNNGDRRVYSNAGHNCHDCACETVCRFWHNVKQFPSPPEGEVDLLYKCHSFFSRTHADILRDFKNVKEDQISRVEIEIKKDDETPEEAENVPEPIDDKEQLPDG
jgi:hypothetical protein